MTSNRIFCRECGRYLPLKYYELAGRKLCLICFKDMGLNPEDFEVNIDERRLRSNGRN